MILLAAAFGAGAPGASAALVGQWTFSDAAGTESTGLWSTFHLNGSASIAGGRLVVAGNGYGTNSATAWAQAGDYSGPAITDKTLVAWLTLDDDTAGAGSPLSLFKTSNAHFDAIDYAEQEYRRWTPGSDNFLRTHTLGPSAVDNPSSSVRQIAITYQGNGLGQQTISGCLDGVALAPYTTSSIETFSPGAEGLQALFGPRHLSGASSLGSLDAHITESRVYDQALSCTQVAALAITAPTVTTGAATQLTTSGATLNATVNPETSATTYHFEYGTSIAYGQATAPASAGNDGTDHAETASIAGLAAGTTYHVRVVATNPEGTSNGADQTFTTASPAPIPAFFPAPAPDPTPTDASPPADPMSQSASSASVPALTRLTADRRCVRAPTLITPQAGRSGLSFGFSLSLDATVRYEILHRIGSPRWARCPSALGTTPGTFDTTSQYEQPTTAGSHDTAVATVATARALRLRRGVNHVALARLAAGQQLAPGTYILRLTAFNAVGRSSTATVKFWVVNS